MASSGLDSGLPCGRDARGGHRAPGGVSGGWQEGGEPLPWAPFWDEPRTAEPVPVLPACSAGDVAPPKPNCSPCPAIPQPGAARERFLAVPGCMEPSQPCQMFQGRGWRCRTPRQNVLNETGIPWINKSYFNFFSPCAFIAC